MKRFLLHSFFFVGPVIILTIGYYVLSDPFMSIWKYENYTPIKGKQCLNDVVRAVRYMDQYDDSLHYNSFILGSSRSDFFYVDDWKHYLSEDASCFHFNQSFDNLLGTYQRVKYLYDRFDRIDNLLIVVDAEYLRDISKHKGHLFRIPPTITKNPIDWAAFRWEEMSAFYNLEFQKEWLQGTYSPGNTGTSFSPYINEIYKVDAEYELNNGDTTEFWASIPEKYQLYQRDGYENISDVSIMNHQLELLKEISRLAESYNTDVRIVVSPLYDQIRLNPLDLQNLRCIFGEDKVYDFSGKNEYTNNKLNYYENSHYRPCLTRILLDKVYENK